MCEGHKQKKGSSYVVFGLVLSGDLFMCSTLLCAIIIHLYAIIMNREKGKRAESNSDPHPLTLPSKN